MRGQAGLLLAKATRQKLEEKEPSQTVRAPLVQNLNPQASLFSQISRPRTPIAGKLWSTMHPDCPTCARMCILTENSRHEKILPHAQDERLGH